MKGNEMEVDKRVDISSALNISGWMNESELTWLAAQALKCAVVVEIGSWCGRSSLAIAEHLPDHGCLYCVDGWNQKDVDAGMGDADAEKAMEEFQKNLAPYLKHGNRTRNEKVVMWRDDSEETAQVLLRAIGKESVDWVFIDGDHSYEVVKRDIESYLPLLRVGGLLSGHDYWFASVRQAVDEARHNVVTPVGSIWCSIKDDV